MSLLLCFLALVGTYLAGRRSLLAGLLAALVVGYFFGITRANLPDTFSYFIFDAAALGLFASRLFQPLPPEERARLQPLLAWLCLLIGWPLILLLVPVQDPMVQLVGLRSHIFLLPFILFGARLSPKDRVGLAVGLAALNLIAFSFAAGEFLLGVERFYPRNAVTELIYKSKDAAGYGQIIAGFDFLRIPAIFSNSAAYAGTMVASLPLLLGAWVLPSTARWQRALIAVALLASVLGVFLAASRTHFLALALVVVVSSVTGGVGAFGQLAWVGMLAVSGLVVMADPRLQRFMSIDAGVLVDRVSVSVNDSFFDLMLRYPMGNGLGGGGTSMPYFLQHLIRNPIGLENEYARIMLEQGVPGLMIWLAFLVWVHTRRQKSVGGDGWLLGRRLSWIVCGAYFATGMIGTGLLTSIPFTALLLMGMGWIGVPAATVEPEADSDLAVTGEGEPALGSVREGRKLAGHR